MNKKIAVLAFMSLSAGVVLAGCQSLQDQMGAKLAEGIINSSTNGQVKVNLNDLNNGKVTVQTKDGTVQLAGNATDSGGTLNMTDASGKTVTYKGNSGDSRPADVPADMPTLDNGGEFAYFTVNGMTSVTFKVNNNDLKTVCQKEMSLLEGAGWTVDAAGTTIETSDAIYKSYVKGNEDLTVTCGLDSDQSTIALQKTTKTS